MTCGKMNKSKLILVLAFVTFTAFTFINPVYPHEQFLQHAGTVLLLIPLIADVMKDRMPLSAFVGILLFAILHVIGARYIYSNVPYKEWSVSLGIVDADFFQDTRNHYDRFVHLCFGVLLFPYLQYAAVNGTDSEAFKTGEVLLLDDGCVERQLHTLVACRG